MVRKIATRMLTLTLALLLVLALPVTKANAAMPEQGIIQSEIIPNSQKADTTFGTQKGNVYGSISCDPGFANSSWEVGETVIIPFLMTHSDFSGDQYYLEIYYAANGTYWGGTYDYIDTSNDSDASTLWIWWNSSGMSTGEYYVRYWSTYTSSRTVRFRIDANNSKKVPVYEDFYHEEVSQDWHYGLPGNKANPHRGWDETVVTPDNSALPEYGIMLFELFSGECANELVELEYEYNILPFNEPGYSKDAMHYVVMGFALLNYGDIPLKVSDVLQHTNLHTSYGSRMTVNAIASLSDDYRSAVVQPGDLGVVWMGVCVKKDQGLPVIGLECGDGYTFINTDPNYEEPAGEWVKVGGKWYFTLPNGEDATGWWLIDDEWYFFDENGVMASNKWVRDGDDWCYMGADGTMVTNKWVKDGSHWCYIDADGYMVTNDWAKDGNKWCYVDKNGYQVFNKWVKDGSHWCYIGSDGYMVKNKWVKDGSHWCYIGSNGYMVTNSWAKDGSKWCYMDKNGYQVFSKWVKDGSHWCYIGSNGYMVTNKWVKDGAQWCYMGANGHQVFDQWAKDGKYWAYIGSDGYMLTNQWVKDGSSWAYVDGDGHALTGTHIIDGKEYTFDKNGTLIGKR